MCLGAILCLLLGAMLCFETRLRVEKCFFFFFQFICCACERARICLGGDD